MRRNAGRHANGNPSRTIGEEIWKACRQDHRFFIILIVSRFEIDGIFGEAIEQQLRCFGHPAFCVTHGGGAIAVNIPEIALTIDERIANREILREADHRVINRGVAMRVVITHDFADDFRTLTITAIWIELELAHAIQDAALNRLQAIADIWQSA